MLMKGHHRASFFRHEGKAQVSKATTNRMKDTTCNYDMCDWTPVTKHMKEHALLIISLYFAENIEMETDCGRREALKPE